MTFEAQPGAIHQFGDAVRSLSDESRTAQAYAEEWLAVGYAEGRMFVPVVETAERVRESLMRGYGHLAELAASSAAELGRTADRYTSTDDAVAQRLERLGGAAGLGAPHARGSDEAR